MPTKPSKPCKYPNCPQLTYTAYCPEHKKLVSKKYELTRETAVQRGYDSRWQKIRKRYLLMHPYCVECLKLGRSVLANVVDHIIPHKGDKDLFYDENNWQSMCTRHHNQKTVLIDGGLMRDVK